MNIHELRQMYAGACTAPVVWDNPHLLLSLLRGAIVRFFHLTRHSSRVAKDIVLAACGDWLDAVKDFIRSTRRAPNHCYGYDHRIGDEYFFDCACCGWTVPSQDKWNVFLNDVLLTNLCKRCSDATCADYQSRVRGDCILSLREMLRRRVQSDIEREAARLWVNNSRTFLHSIRDQDSDTGGWSTHSGGPSLTSLPKQD